MRKLNFDFTEEQNMLRETVRSFVDKEIVPYIREWDRSGGFPREIFDKLRELGLMGVCIPEKYGGSGMDYNSLAIVCEELERGDTAFRTAVSVHTGLNSLTLLQWGTEEQKQKIFGSTGERGKNWRIRVDGTGGRFRCGFYSNNREKRGRVLYS